MLPLVHHPLQMCMEVAAHLQFHALFLLDPQYVKQNRLDPQNRLKRYILLYILRTLGIFYCLLWKKEKKRYVWVILPLITADVDGPYRLVPFESNPESPPSPLWFINGVVSPECISSDWVQSVLNSFEYPPSAPRFLLFVLRLYWHLSWIYFVLTTSVYSSQRVLVQTSSDWLFHSFTDYDTWYQ